MTDATQTQTDAVPKRLLLRRVVVRQLFGLYDHDITLHDPVSILHGPNGVGKTTLLRMIAAVSSGALGDLERTLFTLLELYLNDGSVVALRRAAPRKPGRAGEVTAGGAAANGELIEFTRIEAKPDEHTEHMLRFEGYEASSWRSGSEHGDDPGNSLAELLELLPRGTRITQRLVEPSWLCEVQSQLRVRFVETDRLARRTDPWAGRYATGEGAGSAVADRVEAVKQAIQSAAGAYATKSQELDRTFPIRVRGALADERHGRDRVNLALRLADLERRRSRLEQLRVLVVPTDAPAAADEVTEEQDEALTRVMSLYSQDLRDKLAVLEPVAARVELLTNQLNDKLRNKRVRCDAERGIVVTRTTDGEEIPLEGLSSGEQHQIVVLCDLLFRTEPGTLVLIDEPELSQHVSWQRSFIRDLLDICRVTGTVAIVATHSPQIVGNHRDLLIGLDDDPDEAPIEEDPARLASEAS